MAGKRGCFCDPGPNVMEWKNRRVLERSGRCVEFELNKASIYLNKKKNFFEAEEIPQMLSG